MAANARRAVGLERLFGSLGPESQTVLEIPLSDVRPGANVRRRFDPEKLQELADSIREHGVLQPVLVAPDGAGYVLIAGERRWRAAQMVGLSAIPALVRQVSPEEAAALMLIENLQRQDLDEVERAEGLVALKGLLGTWDAVIRATGLSKATVMRCVRLAALPEDAKDLVRRGAVAASTAVEVARAVEPGRVAQTLQTVAERGVPREVARTFARSAAAQASPPGPGTAEPAADEPENDHGSRSSGRWPAQDAIPTGQTQAAGHVPERAAAPTPRVDPPAPAVQDPMDLTRFEAIKGLLQRAERRLREIDPGRLLPRQRQALTELARRLAAVTAGW